MIESIDLSSAILGLFMALPLIALRRRRPANLWLGLFVLSLSLLTLADYFAASGAYRQYPQVIGAFDWPVVSIGAFYYCYVRGLTGLGNSRRQAVHFAPLVLFLGYLLWLRLTVPLAALREPGADTGVFHLPLLGFQLLAAAYALAALYRVKRYRQRLHQIYSSTKDRDLAWLVWSSLAMIVLLALWFPATLLGGSWSPALGLARLALLCGLGWYGLHQAVVFQPPEPARIAGTEPAVAADPLPAQDQVRALAEKEKYARSGMSAAARDLIGQRLQRRMTEQREYLESDLKLTELAERIGTSPHLLSQYLNDVLGLSFFDYINGLRVAEVQRMMRQDADAGRALLDLALAAGFNSKSTFNAAFKRINGLTPSAWRRQQRRTSEPIG